MELLYFTYYAITAACIFVLLLIFEPSIDEGSDIFLVFLFTIIWPLSLLGILFILSMKGIGFGLLTFRRYIRKALEL